MEQPVSHKDTSRKVKSRSGSKPRWLPPVLAAVLTLLLYLPTLRYGFVWDDIRLVQYNPGLASISPPRIFATGFWLNPKIQPGPADATYYRPVANLSLKADRAVSGLNAAGYHATNIVLHALVTLLLGFLLLELFGSPVSAGLGALLFGIHPALNCVPCFIANRTYLLALLFFLAGFIALQRGRQSRNAFWPALFGLCALGALLSVETALALVVPVAWWLFQPGAHEGQRRLNRGVWLAAGLASLAVYFVLRFAVAHVPLAPWAMQRAVTGSYAVINSFGQQMLLVFFPFIQRIAYTPDPVFTQFSVYTVLGLLFLALPVWAVLRARRGALATGGLGYAWSVAFLLPFAHLLFLGPAGRMLYLAVPGVLILVLTLLRNLRPQALRVVAWCSVALAAAFGVQTLRRNPVWFDQFSLSQARAREAPASTEAHLDLGAAWQAKGALDSAIAEYSQAIELEPRNAEAWNNRANALSEIGDNIRALADCDQALQLRPDYLAARLNRASVHYRMGDYASARADYDTLLKRDPGNVDALSGRANALTRLGEFDLARADYDAAIRLDPNDARAFNNRGSFRSMLGDNEKGLLDFQQALRIDSSYAEAWFNLARNSDQAGRTAEAIRAYQRFIALAPARRATQVQTARDRLRALMTPAR